MEITINNTNFGSTPAQITFFDSNNNTYELGLVAMPYNYTTDNPYGTYYLYYPTLELTCEYTLNP